MEEGETMSDLITRALGSLEKWGTNLIYLLMEGEITEYPQGIEEISGT